MIHIRKTPTLSRKNPPIKANMPINRLKVIMVALVATPRSTPMLAAIQGTNGAGAIMEKEVDEVTITYATRINHRNFG
jgi:hypothetical protein